MKKYLLPETGKFYKANLHCHTVYSDGEKTQEEIKELYRKAGYSVVAYTDHDVFVSRKELKDDDFLPLNAMEIEFYSPRTPESLKKRPCVHLCLIAKEEDTLAVPLYHRTLYVKHHEEENRARMVWDENEPDFVRGWEVEEINEAIALAKKKGFFVTYNHPEWSYEDATRFTRYRGLDAMEVYNSASCCLGYEECNPMHYNAMARHGVRLFPVAADDNHNRRADSFGGWVQIKAEKLEYRTITTAMEKGDFYASTGPEIYELWTEDDVLHLSCSPAKKILGIFVGGKNVPAFAEGELLTEAEIPLAPERGGIRVAVYGEDGTFATTRFYYPEEW